MHISELFIRKPVFATVVSLILMLIGIVSYDRLSVREYPEIDEPVVTVTTVYRGASADGRHRRHLRKTTFRGHWRRCLIPAASAAA